MKTKVITLSEVHHAFHKDATELLRKHADSLSAMEMLALTSHLVGQVLALQDQRVMTKEAAIQVIMDNIEAGNVSVIDSLLGETMGNG